MDGKNVKLVVSDVDGTLVDGKKKLTDGTVAAVKRLTEGEVGFTIISARPRSGMMPIADALEIDAPMGAFNGGMIFTRDGTIVSWDHIDPAVVRGVFDLDHAGTDVWVFADDKWHASTDQGAHVASERITSDQDPIVTNDFAALYDRADKITFVSDDEALLRGIAEQAKHFSDRATIVQSQTYYLDVTPLTGNKGDGITALAKAFDVPLGQVCAIGDQANDLPMFARAGLSIAMGQGPEAVRAKADRVTGGNDDDGVAQAIDDVILA